jgi:DNA-binding CsgD family transcriptional regulator
MTRKEQITELRKQGKTLEVIAREFRISRERVRQILNSKFCPKHGVNYFDICVYCKEEREYQIVLKNMSKKAVESELVKLSKKGRQAIPSLRRKMLVKKLRDEQGLSFSEIARRMGRDRTTVSHYYYG